MSLYLSLMAMVSNINVLCTLCIRTRASKKVLQGGISARAALAKLCPEKQVSVAWWGADLMCYTQGAFLKSKYKYASKVLALHYPSGQS